MNKLLSETKELVKKEKEYTYKILQNLKEIEETKAYCELGLSSLFKYCVFELNYTEHEAWIRINAMRFMRRDAKIEEAISKDEVSISNAASMELFSKTHNLNKERTLSIFQKTKNLSNRELKIILRPKKQDFLTLKLKYEMQNKFNKIRNEFKNNYSNEDLIEILVDEKLRNYTVHRTSQRYGRYISKAMKAEVFDRAKHCCEFEGCRERKNLQIDHIIPFAKGGLNTKENLRVLCSAHNQYERIKVFGKNY